MEEKNQDYLEFKSYKSIKWSELQLGDIVCLKRGKQSPADLLILDSSQEELLVDFEVRTACSCTFVNINHNTKGNIMDFITKLNGQISFSIQESPVGSIKLKNDPKATSFNKKNMILKGETLDRVDWIFGMAIRVGEDCCYGQTTLKKQNYSQKSWIVEFQTYISYTCWILFSICFISNMVFSSFFIREYFFKSLIYCLLIFPQNLQLLEKICYFFIIIKNNKAFYKEQQKVKNKYKVKKQQKLRANDYPIVLKSQNDRKILMPIEKYFNLPLLSFQRQTQLLGFKSHNNNETGLMMLTSQNVLDLIRTDILILDNPKFLFKAKPKVVQLVENFKTYHFSYNKLKNLVRNASPKQKTNCDKLLIDTNRQQTQDEMKTLDIDLLISEKRVPDLRNCTDILLASIQIQKIGNIKDNNQKDQKQNDTKLNNGIGKKKSARYIFDSSFVKHQQNSNQVFDNSKDASNHNISQSFQSSHIGLQKQKNQFVKPGTIIKQNPNFSQMSQKKINDLNSDRIISENYNEQDFIDILYSQDDRIYNEILVMMLLTNSIISVFNEKLNKLEFIFENSYDESILQFCELLDYNLICSTEQENTKQELNSRTIIKKVISIGTSSKVFEILTFLEPTENRKHILSVLVRDPESFQLDEGALLYTRIETNNQTENKYHENLQEMNWDGLKTFLYQKRQLGYSQTNDILKKLSAISETYGNRSHEIEKLFIELESKSEPIFAIGISSTKQKLLQHSSQEFIQEQVNQERIFFTLQNYNIKLCIIIPDSYDDLMLFVRTYSIIQSKEQIIEFKERDSQQLQYKFRQYLQNLMSNNIPNYQDNFIIVSSEAFDSILEDEYLKYHFVFIFQMSGGLGAYRFTSRQKGKLAKILQKTNQKILSVGNSLDDEYLFSKSHLTVSLMKKEQEITIINSKFVALNIKQLLKMIFLICPRQMQNYLAFLEIQLYRCLLLGLIIFIISFQFEDIQLFWLLIFFLIPSNILSSIQHYFLLCNQKEQTLKFQSTYVMIFQSIKKRSMLRGILGVFVIVIIDLVYLILTEQTILLVISSNGKIDQTSKSVLLYISLELLDKSKILFHIIKKYENIYYKLMQLTITIFILTLLIICFNLVQASTDDQRLIDEFNQQNFLAFIFISVFLIGLSFVTQEILEIYSINFMIPSEQITFEQNQKDILELKKKLNSSNSLSEEEEEEMQLIFNQKIKKITDQLFDNKDLVDEIITKQIKGDQSVVDEMDKFQGFQDKKTEKDFQDFFKQQNQHKFNIFYAFIFYDICILIMYCYEILTSSVFPLSILLTVLIQFIIQLFISLLQLRVITNKKIQQYFQLLSLILRYIFKILIDVLYIGNYQEFVGFMFNIQFILAFAITTQPIVPIIFYVILQLVIYIIDLIINGFSMNFLNQKEVIYCLVKFGFLLVEISYPIFENVQKFQFLQRSSYIYQNRLNIEQKKINYILGLLMPRFIQERMNKGQIQIQQDQGDVTILFCDIYQFDKVIKYEQENILNFLDTLYRAFDQLCQTYDLQKIETVGKTYMAAGGLKDYDAVINQKNANSTTRALETAIAMMDAVKTMKYGDNQDVKLKIGIHYGRVIAGVIGVHKPQFSLIGDTVNTTSRVCSTGDAGFITLSESAYNNIKDTTKYQFDEKAVAAKGKGTLLTFRFKVQLKDKDSTRLISSKLIKDHQESSNETRVQVMPLKNPENKKPPAKILMKRASVMNPIGLGNDPNKSPILVLRQLQQQLQNKKTFQIMIKKKQSIDHETKEQEVKRQNSQKSISSSNQDLNQGQQIQNENQSQVQQQPKVVNTNPKMRSSILQLHKPLKRGNEDGAIQHYPSTLQQFSMSLFQPISDIRLQPSSNQISSSQNQQSSSIQPQLSVLQQNSQTQMVQILEHPSKESIKQVRIAEEAQNQQNNQQPQRGQIKRKGTVIMADLVNKKKMMKSNTKIILPEDKERPLKLVQKENENHFEGKGKQIENPGFFEAQENLIKKENDFVENSDEIEINKKQSISKLQQRLDLIKLKNIKKFKLDFDKDFDYELNKSQYDSKDHVLYYQIYEEYNLQEFIQFRKTFILLLILMICKSLLYFLLDELNPSNKIELIIVILCQLIVSVLIIFPFYKFQDLQDFKKAKSLSLIYFISISSLNILIVYFVDEQEFEIILQLCQITSIYINLFHQQLFILKDKQYLQIIYFILLILLTVYKKYILEIVFFIISTDGLTYYFEHQVNEILVKNYRVSQQLQTQIFKYENILQYLMPPHALKRLLQPESDKTETFIDVLDHATVLFADIAGFTKYSSSVQPETVVEMLRNLFQSFDLYCQMAQIYKLFTIGDCYVCMGVLDYTKRDPAEEAQKVLAFGLKMIQIINDIKQDPQYQHLNMRIGVHTGRVLGGVVGTDVVRYDIYGEDVTIANLMESSGTEGKMLISDYTKNLVESEYDDFKFEYAKDVYIQSKDMTIPTFFVSLNDLDCCEEN
ncbi:unnamed protein product (macronuclear) [Paramecium tetraurelia]|nr:uncharacterized protein GSPATT00000356001 [Paramecium tetraurelia]CAK55921.1 unnamed protein product [Paramecium tetraurelia]|eukprot:XP_001423319.1 hypothetical protein (macronuclear) [Paramecium tetraurelia strain d4-2]